MKKIITALSVLFASTALKAQDVYSPLQDKYVFSEVYRNAAMLFFFCMIGVFVITLVRLSLDHRLKTKMIEKGVSEHLATQFLRSTNRNVRNESLKWFFIFASLGIGLGIVTLFPPYGLHSMAIISSSISAGFLGYYFFAQKTGDQSRDQLRD